MSPRPRLLAYGITPDGAGRALSLVRACWATLRAPTSLSAATAMPNAERCHTSCSPTSATETLRSRRRRAIRRLTTPRFSATNPRPSGANSTFVGSDYHAQSIETARRRAEQAGVGDRARFEVEPAAAYTGEGYDLVTMFDCLHDMGDPVSAGRHVREAIAPDGTWMIVEPAAGDRVEDNFNPVGRAYYGFSTLLCTPASLSQDVGLALGAQAGEARLREVVEALRGHAVVDHSCQQVGVLLGEAVRHLAAVDDDRLPRPLVHPHQLFRGHAVRLSVLRDRGLRDHLRRCRPAGRSPAATAAVLNQYFPDKPFFPVILLEKSRSARTPLNARSRIFLT